MINPLTCITWSIENRQLNEYSHCLYISVRQLFFFNVHDFVLTSAPQRFWRTPYTGWSEQENLLFAGTSWISAIQPPASKPCTLSSQSVRYSYITDHTDSSASNPFNNASLTFTRITHKTFFSD